MIEKENPGRDDNVGFRPSRFGFETLGCNFFCSLRMCVMYVRKTFPNPLRVTDVIPKMKELFLPPLFLEKVA